MTLRTLMQSGIHFEGFINIQCWETEDNATVYCKGCNTELDIPEHILDREIRYIFPYTRMDGTAAFCIEIAEE